MPRREAFFSGTRETEATFLLAILLAASFLGCTSAERSNRDSARLHKRQAQLWANRQRKEDAEDRNLVLQEKAYLQAGQHAPLEVKDQTSVPVRFADEDGAISLSQVNSGKAQAVSENPPVDLRGPAAEQKSHRNGKGQPLPPYLSHKSSLDQSAQVEGEEGQTSEQIVYAKVLDSYRRHRVADLEKSLQLLIKNSPDSVYADNAVYLAGMLAFEGQDLQHAEYYMDRIIQEYPRGKKVPAAIFAKAYIEQKRGQLRHALGLLSALTQAFPGSPEAARARFESRLWNQHPAKKKEG